MSLGFPHGPNLSVKGIINKESSTFVIKGFFGAILVVRLNRFQTKTTKTSLQVYGSRLQRNSISLPSNKLFDPIDTNRKPL